jgi:2-polyprenyl-6-methoxyphenol hydroxylase-like FAD-dependent oxidoreductase
MRQFPAGLLVMGDAICSFNPVYMQGMTMAALQAVALRNCLADRDGDLSRRFFKATAKQIAPVWRANGLTDFTLSQGGGWRWAVRRLVNWHVDKVYAAVAKDPAVAEAILRDEPCRPTSPAPAALVPAAAGRCQPPIQNGHTR